MQEQNNIDDNKKTITAVFHVGKDDTISIEGTSVLHIFFELNARFPERFNFDSVEFSGSSIQEKLDNLEKFYNILRRYK